MKLATAAKVITTAVCIALATTCRGEPINVGGSDQTWTYLSQGYVRGMVAVIKSDPSPMSTLVPSSLQVGSQDWLSYYSGLIKASYVFEPRKRLAGNIIEFYNNNISSRVSPGQAPSLELVYAWGQYLAQQNAGESIADNHDLVQFMIHAMNAILVANQGVNVSAIEPLTPAFLDGLGYHRN